MLARMPGDDAFRERVREANDIVVVVGERVALRAAGGGRYKGLCPFHEEKTPSFSVSEERQAYYCFGCRESGDVFAFTMKTEGLDFPGALAALARRAGIPMPERNPKKASRTEVLRKANELARLFFRRKLKAPEGRRALDYLRERGLSDRTIDECDLGFAPDGWNQLGDTLDTQGIPASALVELGLSREGKGGKRYDFFRDRLIVPIHDAQGRVAGFAGRSLDGSEPKYVNSPESPIYHKRSVLYGLDRARPAIRAERSAVLFEGYFDCLSAWQAGLPGAVAVCGTALSPEHARLLAPSCREVVVAFDSDSAGRKAAEAAVSVLLAAGLSVRVASFEEGGDPDDAIREQGGAAFRERLAAAPGFLDFLVDEALGAPGGAAGSDARREAARRVAEVVAGSADALARDDWTREAAGRLGFSPDAFAAEVERARQRPARVSGTAKPGRPVAAGPPQGSPDEADPARPPTPVERDLILWAESRPGEVARLLRETGPEDLEGLATTALLLEMKEAAAAGREDWEGLVGRSAAEPGPVQRQVNEILMAPVRLNEEGQRPEDCFAALRLRRLRRDQERLRARAREGAEGGAAGEDTLREILEVTREIEEVRARMARGA